MKVYQGLENFEGVKNAVVTAGTFDGVHLGHQKIISRLKEIAKEIDGETLLITYSPHPRTVLQPDSPVQLLNSLDEKLDLLEEFGIDHVLVIPFTKEFSRTTSIEFIRDILVNLIHTKKLVIGYDHQFGRNREGSFEHLKECAPLYGFDLEEIQAEDIDNVNVSSTKIRRALVEGEIEKVNSYLGHSYILKGVVVNGKRLGTEIGFPTANISFSQVDKLLPKYGVYAVWVDYEGGRAKGMLNIGVRPTVNRENDIPSIEVNIFEEVGDLYGKELQVSFQKRIRDEISFDNLDGLKEQLSKDKEAVINAI